MKVLALAVAVVSLGALDLQDSGISQWQDVIRNLRNPDVKVRLEAVQRLGEAGYTAAAEYVAPLLTDPDDRVQAAALDAELTFFLIESIGGRRVLSFTGGSRSRAQEAFDAGPAVRTAMAVPVVLLDNLIAAIRDQNARIRFDAIHTLGVVGEAPLAPAQAKALVDGLDHYDAVMRAATARVIGRLGVTEAGDKLVAGLNDSNQVVRRYSAEALGLLKEERAVQALTDAAAFYRSNELASEMMLALGRIAHGSSRDLFRARLSDTNPVIRGAAAEGLGRLKDRDSLEALRTMSTKDSSQHARLAATFAIDRLGEPHAHVIAGALADSDLAAQARSYLIEIGQASVPGITAALGVATDGRFRAELVHLLGFVGTRDTIALIESYNTDRDERVSRAAHDARARLAR